MNDLKKLTEEMICSIVDNPKTVKVTTVEGEQTIILKVKVDKQDLGHVIGQQGRNISAIRTVLRAAGSKDNLRVIVELLDSIPNRRVIRQDD